MVSRGLRNNNPGNIDFNPRNKWTGQTGIEVHSSARFATFSEPVFGIRAIARLLVTYQQKHKLMSVFGLINRWAPVVENDTNSYVHAVARKLGVGIRDNINVKDRKTMDVLVKAIILHENGSQPYSDAVVNRALDLAGIK